MGRALRPPAEELELARVRVDLATRVAGFTRLTDFASPTARGVDMAGIQPVLFDLLGAMARMTGAVGAVLHIYDWHVGDLFAHVATPSIGSVTESPRIARGQGPIGRALDELAAVTVAAPDLSTVERSWLAGAEIFYSAPLLTLTREPMGVISLVFTDKAGFEPRAEMLIAAYASQAAEMIERTHLHSEAHALLTRDRLRSE